MTVFCYKELIHGFYMRCCQLCCMHRLGLANLQPTAQCTRHMPQDPADRSCNRINKRTEKNTLSIMLYKSSIKFACFQV